MAMVSATLVTSLTNLWTNPPESREWSETGDAIETLWSTAAVSGGASSATIYVSGATHPALEALGNSATPAAAAQGFEDACTTLVTGTTFTPLAPVTVISAPPTRLTASVGSLKSALQPIFEDPESGTSAATQANAIASAIYTYLAGWQVLVTIPPTAPVATPIL